MVAMLRAAISAATVLALPGALIASLLGMPFRALKTWAAIPVFSLAAVFVLGEFTNLVSVPFAVPAFVALVAVLALGALARRRFGPAKATKAQDKTPSRTVGKGAESALAYCLLATGIALGAFTWARGLRGVALGPARNDGSHHAYFVARILNTDALDLSKVLIADPLGRFRTLKFYPLGSHASEAIATRLVSADIGRMLIVFVVLFAAVVFPVGMFVLARMLAPQHPLVAGFSALLVPALSIFPYEPSTWGGVALIVGMSMVPITVVLVTEAVSDRETPMRLSARFILGLVPAGLALLAAVSVHSSQLPLIVLLVTLLVVQLGWRSDMMGVLRNALVRGLFAFFLALVLFAPTLANAGGGISERTSIDPVPSTTVGEALGPILTLHISTPARQGVFAAVALLGACIWLVTTRRPAWVVGWLAIVALTLLASTSKGTLSHALTLPWYHIPQRINYNQAFFVAFFAAVPFAFLARATVRLLHSPRWLIPATGIGIALFVGLIGLHGYGNARAMLHDAYAAQGVRPASVEAYRWLAHHANAHDTVVNDAETDGSLWMYPSAGLNPLFGFPTAGSLSDQPQRTFLRNEITLLGRDPAVETIARRYHARWVYLDERTFPDTRHVLDLEALRSNPNFVEVLHHQTVHIFKITFTVHDVDRVPPTTSVFVASKTPPTISGRVLLGATASDDVRIAKVELHVSGGSLADRGIGTAKRTYYGWFSTWDTRSFPDGTYSLTSVALDDAGNSSRSSEISITVQNGDAGS